MASPYTLEKWIWTTDDFEQMGWHDVRVHALAEESENWELLLDIDYLFKWNEPAPGETYYSFWIAPCTLVFHNVADLHIDIEPISSSVMQISNVSREGPRPPRLGFENQNVQVWNWTMEFFNGATEFESTGYTQFVRQAPVFNNRSQDLTLSERGGFCFDRGRTDRANK